MNRKVFLRELENNQGKNLVIEATEGIIKKTIIEKYKYTVKEDILVIQSSINLSLAITNLNNIRNIVESLKSITIFLENKEETKIKINITKK